MASRIKTTSYLIKNGANTRCTLSADFVASDLKVNRLLQQKRAALPPGSRVVVTAREIAEAIGFTLLIKVVPQENPQTGLFSVKRKREEDKEAREENKRRHFDGDDEEKEDDNDEVMRP